MFITNAHIIQMYFPTFVGALYAWCSHADGCGEGSEAMSESLWETKAWVLIVCSSYNVPQLPIMYQ